ncbi:hypothetical protein PG991_006066 [Apiospora marii]|uniref:Uncharacterized protein n=1 Tax=Apiospora marii TaxID=335849 RepID=A0ABR1SC92_9PEZI
MPEWTDNELAHMLAWVDHCKDNGLNFKTTAVKRLVDMTDTRRSEGAIMTYMYHYKINSSDVPNLKPHMDVLLNRGTAIFPHLSGNSDLANKVREIKASLAAIPPAASVAQNAGGGQRDGEDHGEDHGEGHGEEGHGEEGHGEGHGEDEGHGEHGGQGEDEDLPDRRVQGGFASLRLAIERACEILSLHDEMNADDDTFQLLAKTAFGSLWRAFELSKVEETREAFLRSFVTAHIFHVALASEFPSDCLDIKAPYVKMLFAVDFRRGLLDNESPKAGEALTTL